ncbi:MULTISPECIES: hypothetical protein [Bacillus cereus group]|nr:MULTISPECIES: hypothetical protein [Bacillus cereus group]
MSDINLEELLAFAKENNDYDSGSVTIGSEQKASSQYPSVTTPDATKL